MDGLQDYICSGASPRCKIEPVLRLARESSATVVLTASAGGCYQPTDREECLSSGMASVCVHTPVMNLHVCPSLM
ncbi:hypothetical protein R3I94_018277 [Phoxinus phoxinus]